jgi:hypothetical protein
MAGTTLEIFPGQRKRSTSLSRHPRTPVRDFVPAVGLVLLLIAAAQLVLPSAAGAISLNPIDWIGKGIDVVTGGVTGGVASIGASVVVKGFIAILNSLFSGLEAHITLKILTWLTSSDAQSGGHVATLYSLTSGMAIGLLGAVLTVSFLRYWLSGLSLSGRGGFEAVEALLRTIAAVAGLLVWPFVFRQLIALGNVSSATILGDPALRSEIAKIINTVVFVTFTPTGVLGLFVSIVLAVAGALLFLGLLFLKVMSGAALTFLYVAMPLAIIVWPLDELAWLSRHAFRAFFALVLIPVIWALIFATFAAVSVNALEFQGASGFVNQVTQPLVAIAMLWLTVTIPRTLFKLATGGLGLTRHGGGFLSHAGSYLAARQASAFLTDRGLLPFGPGGFTNGEDAPAQPGASRGPTTDGVWTDARDPNASGGDGDPGSGSAAGNVGEVVEQLAASTAGPAAAAAEAAGAVTDAAGDSEAPADFAPAHDDGTQTGAADTEVQVPAGAVEATGPAVGRFRPARDNPALGAMSGPPQTDANQKALGETLANVRNLPPPPVEAIHAAWRNLESTSPGVHQRMRQAYDQGGANAVRLEAARLSTSDQISNAQAQDLVTTARAAEHQMIEPLLGIEAPPQVAPSSAGNVPATPVSPSPAGTPPPPSAPAAREAFTREQSAHAAERDEAWRDAGPSVQPHID